MLTKSRVFSVDPEKPKSIKVSAVKSEDNQVYVSLDHPVVMGFEPLTPQEQILANTEYLQAIDKNFWDTINKAPKDTITKAITLKEDFIKIPSSDWVALIKLYADFCKTNSSELEVGGLIICNKTTKELRIVIPEQVVTKASIDWSISKTANKKIYFLDGTELPYVDLKSQWDFMGMTHSHNTMFTSPSGTDDMFELGTTSKPLPTGLHILVGSFSAYENYEFVPPKYDVFASISHLGHRHRIEDLSKIIDLPDEQEYLLHTFAPEVLKVITTYTYKTTYTAGSFPAYSPIGLPPSKPAYPSFSQADKREQRDIVRLDLMENDMGGLEHLERTSRQNKAARSLVKRAAHDLL